MARIVLLLATYKGETMKQSHYATILKKFGLVLAGVVISSTTAWAQSNLLLTISAQQFYPASGYPAALGNQNLPAGFQTIVFRADSGRSLSGNLTIRCRGGREYRNVGLVASGYQGSTVRNPCLAENQFNFDIYLSTNMAGTYDNVRVYGVGYLPPTPPTHPPGYPPVSGDLVSTIDYSRFYPAQGYMAVGSQYLASGYSRFTIRASDYYSPVSGKLTIRCSGGSEYRNVPISSSYGGGAVFSNPCHWSRTLNIDLYLSSPRVGPGTYGQIQIFGQR